MPTTMTQRAAEYQMQTVDVSNYIEWVEIVWPAGAATAGGFLTARKYTNTKGRAMVALAIDTLVPMPGQTESLIVGSVTKEQFLALLDDKEIVTWMGGRRVELTRDPTD